MAANRQQQETEPKITQAKATAFAVIALLAGFWAGYFYRGQAVESPSASGVASANSPQHEHTSGPAPVTEHDLQVHLAVLKKDPKNLQALVQVGNIYYDSQRYGEAIAYYHQALAIQPDDVNVRTDLGTAYWYANKPQQAVEQFQLALQQRPAYPQTLFNLGIVKLHGLDDPAGAIAAWENLLSSNPAYPEAEKVRSEIDQARSLLKVKHSTK